MKRLLLCTTCSLFLDAQPPTFEVYPFAGRPLEGGQLVREGPANQHRFWTPAGSFINSSGDVFLSDTWLNTIWRLDSSGQMRPHLSDLSLGRRFVMGKDGAAYVTSPTHDSIRRIDASTRVATIWAGANRLSKADGTPILNADINPTDIALGQDGLIYFTDSANHRVRRISGDGKIETVAGTGAMGTPKPGDAASSPVPFPADISLDSLGRVYFRTAELFGKIYRVDSQRRIELLVDPIELYKADPFRRPPGTFSGVTISKAAPNGDLYFFDRELRRIILRSAGGRFGTVAGGGTQPFRAGSVATDVRIGEVEHIHLDPQNRPVILFSDLQQYYRIEFDGRLKLLAGVGGGGGDEGPASEATIIYPKQVSLGSGGSVYLLDSVSHRVRVVNSNGVIRTAAGTGLLVYSDPCVRGAGPDSDIGLVHSMVADQQGNIWTTHAAETAVCLAGPDGMRRPVLTFAAFKAQSGTQQPPTFQATTIDRQDNLIAGSSAPDTIWRITPGGQITRLAGQLTESGISPDGTPALQAKLRAPSEVAIGPDGNVYFIEAGGNVIRYVDSAGILRSLNTPSTMGFPRDGERFATAASPRIRAIAWDAQGRLYYCGEGSRIYRVEPDGTVWQIAGTPEGAQTSTPFGPALGVDLGVLDMVIDATGVLYAADLAYRRVFRMNSGGAQRLHLSDGNGQSAPAGRALAKALRVRLLGPNDAPVSGRAVRFEVVSGDARVSRSEVTTNAAGEAWTHANLGSTPGQAVVRATSTDAGSVEFSMTATSAVPGPRPILFEESLVGAGFSSPPVQRFSANGLVTVFGEDLAAPGTFRVVGLEDLIGLQLPSTLADVCVEVNSVRAPLLLVAPGQVNFVFPSVGTSGRARVRLLRNCGTSSPVVSNELTADLAAESPEFLSFGKTEDGKPLVAAISALTGELIAPAGAIPGVVTRPARPNEALTLFAVGLGETRPVTNPGQIRVEAANLIKAFAMFSRYGGIGGLLYAGIAPGYAGLYQLNFKGLPWETAELLEIYMFFSPELRSPSVYLAVAP
jgi:uncharacterized protein (TIGR03437 family)